MGSFYVAPKSGQYLPVTKTFLTLPISNEVLFEIAKSNEEDVNLALGGKYG